MRRLFTSCSVVLLFSLAVAAPVFAQAKGGQPDTPAKIFEDARNEFFSTIERYISVHPRRAELSGDDMLRLHNAPEIPYLFERVMNLAYQKDEPQFSEWLRKGDAESMKLFRQEFIDLAKEYGARFVGSLFLRERNPAFAMAMPHNRGKSRLELVLQTLGYNAKNDPAPVPAGGPFSNKIPEQFYDQWAVGALNLTKAHQAARGSGVVVAVLDTGLDPYNSLFKGKTVPGFSFLQRTKAPWEDDPESRNMVDWGWHGTAVSSVLMLVAPDCRIMPIRTLDGYTMNDPVNPYWAWEFYAASIYYAVNHGAQVINISAPVPSSEPVLWQAVRYAYSKNVAISAGAGNVSRAQWGIGNTDKMYRSFDTELLLVGGVALKHGRYVPWEFSLPGPQVTVGVPSDNVFLIAPVYADDLKDSANSGTSLATPIVSGIAALMRSAAPPSPELLSRPGAYVKLVRSALTETARLDVLGLSDPNDIVGAGLADASAAVQRVQKKLAGINSVRTAK